MDYNQALTKVRDKINVKCRIHTQNPMCPSEGGVYYGIFKKLCADSIVIEVGNAEKALALKYVNDITFE